MKKQKNTCIIISLIIFILGIIYTTILTDSLAMAKIFNLSLGFQSNLKTIMLLTKLIYKVTMIILSVITIIKATNYSKEYKKITTNSPNGYGLMTLGAILNIIGFWPGCLLNLIGSIFALLNKNYETN